MKEESNSKNRVWQVEYDGKPSPEDEKRITRAFEMVFKRIEKMMEKPK